VGRSQFWISKFGCLKILRKPEIGEGPPVSLTHRLNARTVASSQCSPHAATLSRHLPLTSTAYSPTDATVSLATCSTLSIATLIPAIASRRNQVSPFAPRSHPAPLFCLAPPLRCCSRAMSRIAAPATGAATLMRRAESSLSVPSPQARAPHRGASSKIHAPSLPPRSASTRTGTSGHETAPPTRPRAPYRPGEPRRPLWL
jgi:hypothetical protein